MTLRKNTFEKVVGNSMYSRDITILIQEDRRGKFLLLFCMRTNFSNILKYEDKKKKLTCLQILEQKYVCVKLDIYRILQVGLDKTASEDTRILYCTTGILLNKLINEKNMNHYTHVILDEVRR